MPPRGPGGIPFEKDLVMKFDKLLGAEIDPVAATDRS
jgi:hypothetical protein